MSACMHVVGVTCPNCVSLQEGGVHFVKPDWQFALKVPATSSAVKYDGGKPAFDLLPAKALEELAKVYSFGASKYSRRNWEKGMNWCRIFGAIMRHSWAWMRGETFDLETGLHHMAHAAFGCLALVEYQFSGAGKDDRGEIEEIETPERVAAMFPKEQP